MTERTPLDQARDELKTAIRKALVIISDAEVCLALNDNQRAAAHWRKLLSEVMDVDLIELDRRR